jgi:superfamily II DNA helicase RecQ
LGYRGSPKGDSLDFSVLGQDEAEAISDRLYELYLGKRIRVYAPKEAVLEIALKSTDKLSWNARITTAAQLAKKQLDKVRRYGESNLCKRQTLLAEFEETITECSGCQICANGDTPWLSLYSFSDQELKDAYNPLHTVVAFMELHAGRQANNEYHGLGKAKINMALRGEEVSPTNIFRLGPRELNNPYFGRLAFIRASEIESAIGQAEKLGYLSSQPYENSSTYQITEAGRNWLLARIRKEQGGASA